jgi:hypothetical protein
MRLLQEWTQLRHRRIGEQPDGGEPGRAAFGNLVQAWNRHPAHGKHRQGNGRTDFGQLPRAGVYRARLGSRFENGPEYQVIQPAVRHSLARFLDAVHRAPYDEPARRNGPCSVARNGVSTQMNAMCSADQGHVDAIVDEDARVSALHSINRLIDERLEWSAVHLRLPDLNHVHTGRCRSGDSIEQKGFLPVLSNYRSDQAAHRTHAAR